MRLALTAGIATMGLLAACQRQAGEVKPLAPRAQGADEAISISAMAATVHNADSMRPPCPVRPHLDAAMTVRGVTGKIQYRWERSNGTTGPLVELLVPAITHGAIALQPDDWADTAKGVQLDVDEHVQVSYPFPVQSAPLSISAKCY